MRARNVMLTLVLLLGIFLFALFQKWREPLRREVFNRTPVHLRFYAFARCRMQCLTLNDAHINTLMQDGVINMNKSNRMGRPCPVYAVQARVRGRYVRVLFEQCRNGTYVVNCYDLERATTCDCPTDYQPNHN
jgi:hypothetical protein